MKSLQALTSNKQLQALIDPPGNKAEGATTWQPLFLLTLSSKCAGNL